MQTEFEKKKKSKQLAYLFWFLLGWLGAQRFYLKNPIQAIFMIITLNLFGLWWLIDAFYLGKRVEKLNEQIEAKIIAKVHPAKAV